MLEINIGLLAQLTTSSTA